MIRDLCITEKEETVPDCRTLPAERDPQADPTCPTNTLNPEGGRHCVHKNLKGNEELSSHLFAYLTLMHSYMSPCPFPSSPAEPWLRRGKILIKTLQKAENAWNKVTVTVKCPERPIRNCNTESFITTNSSLIINQWILLEKKNPHILCWGNDANYFLLIKAVLGFRRAILQWKDWHINANIMFSAPF